MKQQQPQRNYLQEVFYRSKFRLLRQNEKCANAKGFCPLRYRGLKCAVGHLIDDDVIGRHMFKSIEHAVSISMDIPEQVMNSEIMNELITSIIQLHDYHSPDEWPSLYDNIQKKLDIPELLQYEI